MRPPLDKNSTEFWKWAEDNPQAFKNYVQHLENYYHKHPPAIRFFSLTQLKKLGRIPRYPTDEKVVEYKLKEASLYEDNFIVFVSHRWLQKGHPDNTGGSKYRAIVDGITLLLKIHLLNQDEWPAAELQHLEKIIGECDVLFTPLVDDNITKGCDLFNYDYYQSAKWSGETDGYLNRPWCRIEMMYSSHLDIQELLFPAEKRSKMSGYLVDLHKKDRRPHILYVPSDNPNTFYVLPFLFGPLSERFDPTKVLDNVGNESDKEKIKRMMDPNNLPRRVVRNDYVGDRKWWWRPRHGFGIQYYEDGSSYEGDWEDGKIRRKGQHIFADGAVYEGDWKDGQRHGKGKYIFADGAVYEGDWKDGQRHGKGKYIFADGAVYEGDWQDGKRHGKGKHIFASGAVYEGDWQDDKFMWKGNSSHYVDLNVLFFLIFFILFASLLFGSSNHDTNRSL